MVLFDTVTAMGKDHTESMIAWSTLRERCMLDFNLRHPHVKPIEIVEYKDCVPMKQQIGDSKPFEYTIRRLSVTVYFEEELKEVEEKIEWNRVLACTIGCCIGYTLCQIVSWAWSVIH